MSKKIVVALGGNAILSKDASAKAQHDALNKTAEYLAQFIEKGDNLIISHGNGPQVGNLLLQQQASDSDKNPAMPLDTCVAMTEGSIGYWLQNALGSVLKKRGIKKEAITVITQVIVDENDPAFKNPTKPVGPFLTKQEAEAQMKKKGTKFIEDAGRGWRKVVPSPKPISIEESDAVKKLVEDGFIPVSVGGGGVPVVQKGDSLVGVEAVIDKDYASEKLAELVQADILLILTAVDNVFIDFNKPTQKKLGRVTIGQMKKYILENQFAKGSMLPKVQAAVQFVEHSNKGEAIITSLENVKNLLDGESGTIITH